MKLEEKLVSLRKAKGLSQMKLAEKMNVSRQAISRWETGAAIPSSENLKYLSDLYSVSLDYLLSDIIVTVHSPCDQEWRELYPDTWMFEANCADIHGYRAEYATAIYKAHARAIEEIPYDRVNRGTGRRYQSEVYTCRKDEAGKKLDKAAMLICSKALGHNRISVVADNYIRGL